MHAHYCAQYFKTERFSIASNHIARNISSRVRARMRAHRTSAYFICDCCISAQVERLRVVCNGASTTTIVVKGSDVCNDVCDLHAGDGAGLRDQWLACKHLLQECEPLLAEVHCFVVRSQVDSCLVVVDQLVDTVVCAHHLHVTGVRAGAR